MEKVTLESVAKLIIEVRDSTNTRIDNLAELMMDRFDGVAEQFDSVSDQFNGVNDRLDKIEFNTSGQERRISTLEDKVRIISTKIGLDYNRQS
jgi:archaellum component FlaC